MCVGDTVRSLRAIDIFGTKVNAFQEFDCLRVESVVSVVMLT